MICQVTTSHLQICHETSDTTTNWLENNNSFSNYLFDVQPCVTSSLHLYGNKDKMWSTHEKNQEFTIIINKCNRLGDINGIQ